MIQFPSFLCSLLQLKKTNCKNCLVWAKSDDLGREMIKLSKDVVVHCSFFCILYSNDPSIICAYDHMSRTFQQVAHLLQVGYIVMVDKSTGRRTELVRFEGAKVAGVYHPLIHEKVVKVMRRYSIAYLMFDLCFFPVCILHIMYKLNLSFLDLKTDMIRKFLHGLLTIPTPWRRCYLSMLMPL